MYWIIISMLLLLVSADLQVETFDDEIYLDGSEGVEEFQEGITDLVDGNEDFMEKITEKSEEFQEGSVEEGKKEFMDGVSKLMEGIEGSGEIVEKIAEIMEGSEEFPEGSVQEGIEKFLEGKEQFMEYVSKLMEGIEGSGEILEQIAEKMEGSKELMEEGMGKELVEKMAEIMGGNEDLIEGNDTLMEESEELGVSKGEDEFQEGITDLVEGNEDFKEKIAEIMEGSEEFQEGSVQEGIDKFLEGKEQFMAYVSKLMEGIEGSGEIMEQIAEIMEGSEEFQEGIGEMEGNEKFMEGVSKLMEGMEGSGEILEELTEIMEGSKELIEERRGHEHGEEIIEMLGENEDIMVGSGEFMEGNEQLKEGSGEWMEEIAQIFGSDVMEGNNEESIGEPVDAGINEMPEYQVGPEVEGPDVNEDGPGVDDGPGVEEEVPGFGAVVDELLKVNELDMEKILENALNNGDLDEAQVDIIKTVFQNFSGEEPGISDGGIAEVETHAPPEETTPWSLPGGLRTTEQPTSKPRQPIVEEIEIGEHESVMCYVNPCMNGGICNENRIALTYTCECPEFFKGRHCEEGLPNECADNPCKNGGTCESDPNDDTYTCLCPKPYVGRNCSTGAISVTVRASPGTNLLEGECIALTCVLGGGDPVDVGFTWTFQPKKSYRQTVSHKQFYLKAKAQESKDEGTYICEAHTRYSSATDEIIIKFKNKDGRSKEEEKGPPKPKKENNRPIDPKDKKARTKGKKFDAGGASNKWEENLLDSADKQTGTKSAGASDLMMSAGIAVGLLIFIVIVLVITIVFVVKRRRRRRYNVASAADVRSDQSKADLQI